MTAIGGYFSLEPIGKTDSRTIFTRGELLNFGRACLLWIIRARGYKRVWIPEYNCPSVSSYLKKYSIACETYPVDDHLEPQLPMMAEGDGLVYINYFGIKSETCRHLELQNLPLILDLSQAFFYEPLPTTDAFNSCRKFVGVLDGAFLMGHLAFDRFDAPHQEWSPGDCAHLLKRLDGDVAGGYLAFKEMSTRMADWVPARVTSLTERMLGKIDWENVRQRRRANFSYYHEALGAVNSLKLLPEQDGFALCYPFQADWVTAETKTELIRLQIFVPTYWPGAVRNAWTEHTLFLPCDQRYGQDDIERVIDAVKRCRR